MQFKIPQDVLRADKIVAFLTMRQLIILTLGGSIAYGIFAVLNKQYFLEVWIFPVGFVVLITMAFGFLSFHDMPFERAVLFLLEYILRPRQHVWYKMHGDVIRSVFDAAGGTESSGKTNAIKEDKKKSLQDILKIVDRKEPAPPSSPANT